MAKKGGEADWLDRLFSMVLSNFDESMMYSLVSRTFLYEQFATNVGTSFLWKYSALHEGNGKDYRRPTIHSTFLIQSDPELFSVCKITSERNCASDLRSITN
jgi:hypothetical protein